MKVRTTLLIHEILEDPRNLMAPRIHGYNLLGISPLRERANVDGGLGVGEVRLVVWIQLLTRQSQRVVNRV